MIMPPRVRRIALVVHVACSVATIGAVAAFLALALAGLDGERQPAAYIAMEVVAWCVVLPLVFGALLSGLIQALGTQWGLFRHWWVLVKLIVTLTVALVLLLQLELISNLAAAAAAGRLSTIETALRWSPVVHAGAGLLVLLIPVVLSLYKPSGLTRYGWRRQQDERNSPP